MGSAQITASSNVVPVPPSTPLTPPAHNRGQSSRASSTKRHAVRLVGQGREGGAGFTQFLRQVPSPAIASGSPLHASPAR